MIRYALRSTLAVAALGALLLAGCSSSKTTTTTTETGTTSQSSPESAAPHAESEAAVVPANTVAGIWAQVQSEQARLSTAIQNGQLSDVHVMAFGIRDLVEKLVDTANAESPAGAEKLNGLLSEVKASAAKLDEFGDAGNLSATQAEFAKLGATLNAINTAVGAR